MINSEFDEVNKCILSNKICNNTKKTKFILFSYKNNAHLPPIEERSGSLNFLCIMVNEHITLKNHVHNISNK